jgi:hypothetical protein
MTDELKRQWISALERLRYDVTSREPLQARKEYDTHLAVDVTIDGSGQIRMVITRQSGDTKSQQRKSRSGREYKVFLEQNAVMMVGYRLRAGDDLGAVLREMENEIAGKAQHGLD